MEEWGGGSEAAKQRVRQKRRRRLIYRGNCWIEISAQIYEQTVRLLAKPDRCMRTPLRRDRIGQMDETE